MTSTAETYQHLMQQAQQKEIEKKYEEAEIIYYLILKQTPDDLNALYRLSLLYLQMKNMDKAYFTLRTAVYHHPHTAYLHNTFGVLLEKLQRVDEALQSYERAIELDISNASAWNNLGNLHRIKNNKPTALACYEKTLSLDKNNLIFQTNLIDTLLALENYDLVVKHCNDFLKKHSDNVELLLRKGAALRGLKKYAESIDVYHKILKINPKIAGVYNNLGNVYLDQFSFSKALQNYQIALQYEPDMLTAQMNVANVYRDAQQYTKAIKKYEEISETHKDFADAHFDLSLCYLMTGNYEAGWREYEWRWQLEGRRKQRYNFPQPFWQGQACPGKRLLIHSEQGFGDALLFARFIPLVKAKFQGSIIVECRAALTRLLSSLEHVDEWTIKGDKYPSFDYHIPLMSLPLVLETRLDSIPNKVPYLLPKPELIQQWQSLIPRDEKIKVGIIWAGSATNLNKFRSCEIKFFAKLLQIENTSWFSLQKKNDLSELKNYPQIQNLSEYLGDFADTAAAILQMDLIITIDTSVAHLAGALGKPTWVALSFKTDWRWMLKREDCLWYPSMRLFRQPEQDDWENIFSKMYDELDALVKGEKEKLIPIAWQGAPLCDLENSRLD